MPPFQRSVQYVKDLIAFPSVSSTNNRAISDWVSEQLEALDFNVEQTHYVDQEGIEKTNVLALREPSKTAVATGTSVESDVHEKNGLAYFCHTDVVPTQGWNGPGGDPFTPQVIGERLYGRGSCDMKGSLAAMMAAVGTLEPTKQTKPIWIACTADEEVGFLGAKHLVKHSSAYQEIVAQQPLGLIGEPTCLNVVHAHKGIVGLRITSHGKAAHSSTNHGINANRKMVPFLQRLLEINERTEADPRYQDTRFQPSTLSWNFGFNDGCTAVNITPDRSTAWISFRPMPEIDGDDLMKEIEDLAAEAELEVQSCGVGPPMWIDPQNDAIQELSVLAGNPPRTVCYGTDGGELSDLKNRVVFGPGDIAQAHTTDEWITLEQLDLGSQKFSQILERWCW